MTHFADVANIHRDSQRIDVAQLIGGASVYHVSDVLDTPSKTSVSCTETQWQLGIAFF